MKENVIDPSLFIALNK